MVLTSENLSGAAGRMGSTTDLMVPTPGANGRVASQPVPLAKLLDFASRAWGDTLTVARLQTDPIAMLKLLLAIVDYGGVSGTVDLHRLIPGFGFRMARIALRDLPASATAAKVGYAEPSELTMVPGTFVTLAAISRAADPAHLIGCISDPRRLSLGGAWLFLADFSTMTERGSGAAPTLSSLLASNGVAVDTDSGTIGRPGGSPAILSAIDSSLLPALNAAVGSYFVDADPLRSTGDTQVLERQPVVPLPPASLVGRSFWGIAQADDGRVLALNQSRQPVARAAKLGASLPWRWAGRDHLTYALRELGMRAGMDVGTSFSGQLFENQTWRQIVDWNANLGVIDWGVYWKDLEPTRGEIHFDLIDRQLAFAEALGLKVRGHPLIYPGFLPDWLEHGSFSASELIGIMTQHIHDLMGRYRGRIAEWVVVNEPFVEPFRTDDIFYQTIGPEYIAQAFQAARAADPVATLLYNDNENETVAGKLTAHTRQVVASLQPRGLIDGVGLQMHLNGANPPRQSDLVETMRGYGLPVYVTEFDIDLQQLSGSQQQRWQAQATIAGNVVQAVRASGVCRSFTVWEIGDKYSWIKLDLGHQQGDATPFDGSLNPKPEYAALLEAMRS